MKIKSLLSTNNIEIYILVVLLLIFVRSVAVVQSGGTSSLAAVANRHADQLIKNINPEADPQAVKLASEATLYALTKDPERWGSLEAMAAKCGGTNEIIASRIRNTISDAGLSTEVKMMRVCEIVSGSRPVALLPGSGSVTSSALSSIGIKPVQIRREDGLLDFDNFSLLIIGHNAMSGPYRDYYQAVWPILTEYAAAGGKILILSHEGNDWAYQLIPGKVLPSSRSVPDSQELKVFLGLHPAIKGVDIDSLPVSYQNLGETNYTYPLSSLDDAWNVIVGTTESTGSRPVVAELEYGKGKIMICQLTIDCQYRLDIAASRFLESLINYLLDNSLYALS